MSLLGRPPTTPRERGTWPEDPADCGYNDPVQ